jgi:hypothetical protein
LTGKKNHTWCELGHDSSSGVKGNLRQKQNRLYGLKPARRLIMFSLQTKNVFFRHIARKNNKVAQFEKIIGKMA